ncbi:MAG: 50S ribosomal protein L29 [Bryobacteraceae bacterium]|jgi:large subunit ribosomal protein L29
MAKKVDKVRDLDNGELANRDKEAREQIFRLKFQLAMGQTDGIKKYRELRKERARVMTVVRERELHPETAPAPSPKKRGK